MKHFNKIIVIIITFWLSLSVISSYFIYHNSLDEKNKEYLIDINRINAALSSGAIISDIDISQYKYVKAIEHIELNNSKDDFKEFFEGKGIPSSLDYRILPQFDGDKLTEYIRFVYEPNKGLDIAKILIIYNVCLLIMTTIIVLIMFYIRHSVLKPFDEIVEMPFELSKGHLNTGLKESKNRFFGKFLWGLDLLRESLDSHKRRELQLEKEKKTMILTISHDIKTPLSTIKLYSKAIYDNLYETEEKRNEAAKHIEEKVDQIEGFVSDIIATATRDLLDIQINSGEFYISELVKRVKNSYEEKLILLKTEFSFGYYQDVLLKGDIDRIIEVLENIIENAIKYGDGKSICITFSDEDYCKLITVTNSGIPIPRTEFVHLFESFWRGANAHEKNGSGLGLYICKEIMKKMDGDIFAENTEESMSITIVVRYSE